MKVCIFGAGAIGGHLGAKLAQAGVDVTFVARGAHLAALQARGLTLVSAEGTQTFAVRAVGDASEVGPCDYLFVTLKAHGLVTAAPDLARLLGPETHLVSAVNGIPWWYFHGLGGVWEGRTVESVDPGGIVSRSLPPERVIGCIVYPAAEVVEPGVVKHQYGDRYSLGEPSHRRTARVEALSELLGRAGLTAPVSTHLRDELWVKLWGNMAFNPVSVLTGATLDVIVGDAGTRGVCRAMMLEGRAVGQALGARFAISVDRRIEGAAKVGAHKTSMLQDFERGRPVELDALLGAVVELAEMVGIEVPASRHVLALARQRVAIATRR